MRSVDHMRIAIAGASGLLGAALVQNLTVDPGPGIEVIRLVRRAPRSEDERQWDPAGGWIRGPGAGLDDVDAVVVLSGAGIADRPWTTRYRRQILTSRVDSVRTVAEVLSLARTTEASTLPGGADQPEAQPGATSSMRATKDAALRPGRTLLIPSAVGVYGADRDDEVLTETSAVGEDFLARVCRLTERAADSARAAGIRVVALRTGNVLSPSGGYLGLQGLLYRAGLGGPISGGAQWLSWITRADHVRAMRHLLLDSDLEGPVNLTAPEPVRQGDFARAYAASLRRPAVVPLPAGLLRPVLGPDMVTEVLRASQRVMPRRLLDDRFAFDHPVLDDALKWLPTE